MKKALWCVLLILGASCSNEDEKSQDKSDGEIKAELTAEDSQQEKLCPLCSEDETKTIPVSSFSTLEFSQASAGGQDCYDPSPYIYTPESDQLQYTSPEGESVDRVLTAEEKSAVEAEVAKIQWKITERQESCETTGVADTIKLSNDFVTYKLASMNCIGGLVFSNDSGLFLKLRELTGGSCNN